MKTDYYKLVRDNIPKILSSKGIAYEIQTMNQIEYRKALLQKIIEEAREVADTDGSPEELEKELADVLEVVEALVEAFGLNPASIEATKKKRKLERG